MLAAKVAPEPDAGMQQERFSVYFGQIDAFAAGERVGAAIAESGVAREDLFVTTKFWVQDAGYEAAERAFQASFDKLGLDYLDLYLIHQPFNDYYGAWRAIEELYGEGCVRAIGVSNFEPVRLLDLVMNNEVVPAVNQVEHHPFFQQRTAKPLMAELGVQVEGWGPFAEGSKGVFANKALAAIAAKHNRSTAQVILQSGICSKTSWPSRNRCTRSASARISTCSASSLMTRTWRPSQRSTRAEAISSTITTPPSPACSTS